MSPDPTKTHFGTCVHEILQRQGISLEVASRRANIQPTLISKWKSGRWQVIPEKTLLAVIEAAAETQADRDQLAAAYVYDMLPSTSKGLYRVVRKEQGAAGGDIRGLVGGWNTDTRQKLQAIGDAVQFDPDIRMMFDSIATISKRALLKREGVK